MRLRALYRALCAAALFVAATGWASIEFRAIGRKVYPMYKEPSANSKLTGQSVQLKREYLVLGNSVGGQWVKILDDEGNEGWAPLSTLDTYRSTPTEFDPFHAILARNRRVTSLLTWTLGTAIGNGDMGLGFGTLLMFNLDPDGLFGERIDQPELGVGFDYFLGPGDTTPRATFWAVPVVGQWLFRAGDTGSFMIGPRVGAGIVNDAYGRFADTEQAPIFLVGVEVRFFPDEVFGFSADMNLFGNRYFFGKIGFNLAMRF